MRNCSRAAAAAIVWLAANLILWHSCITEGAGDFYDSFPTLRGGMTIAALRLAALDGEDATLAFGDKGLYTMRIENGSLVVASAVSGNLLSISAEEEARVYAHSISSSMLDIYGDLVIQGVKQFRMVLREDFSQYKAYGWDNKNHDELVTTCGGIFMLGGFGKFAQGEVTKRYQKLPAHSELRIKANFHFIDAWIGETGFMRVNSGPDGSLAYVWAERHSQEMSTDAINVCGGSVPEGKFSAAIDVTIPHSDNSVLIGFGSTMDSDDPYDQSWGVKNKQRIFLTPKHKQLSRLVSIFSGFRY